LDQKTIVGIVVVLVIVGAVFYLTRGGQTATTPAATQSPATTTAVETGAATATASPTQSPTQTPTAAQTQTATQTAAATTPAQQLAKGVHVVTTERAVVIVAPKGAPLPKVDTGGKKLIVVQYVVDEEKTVPPEKSRAFTNIDPAFYRNTTVDALIIAARKETNPEIRELLYEAIYKLSNYEVPTLWLGQYKLVRNQWSWLHGRYYHPTLAERYDLLWEDPGAPSVDLGLGGYKNDANTYVMVTIGWPDTFDPAADYETFGWAIWHNIGDTLVTFWKDNTKEVGPDLAVAWAHNRDGTVWYFVIRGGVKAYDPWHGKTYTINATDVLFTIWRVARLGLDPSWMVTEFMDVNNSRVLTEEEFNQLLAKGGIYAEYRGKSIEPKSLDELLGLFGYSGETAGVVELRLYQPYAAILSILSDPFLSVIPMKYLFDNVKELQGKYAEAIAEAKAGKNPAAWVKYVQPGEQDPTHLLLNEKPVGTGPYYVKEYKKDSYIVLEYNEYYWNKTLWMQKPYGENGVPSHRTVIYLINNDAVSRIQILKSGQADTGAIPLDRLKDIKGYQYPGTGFKIQVEEGGLEPTIVFIVLNNLQEPFNNRLVRQALMYAIPFDQINKVVYAGYLARLYGVIPAGFPGHNDNIVIKYRFDIAKAMQLIKQAGIDPAKYTIEVWYNQGNSQREKIASLLQQTWGQLGFKVSVKALNWPTLLGKTAKGDFQVYIIGWAPDYLDPDNYAGPLLYGGTRFAELTITVQG